MTAIAGSTAPVTTSDSLPYAARRARRVPLAAAVLCAAALALTGCGDKRSGASGSAGSVPDGWGTLTTKGADVSFPKSGADGYTVESAAERGRYNAAAAVRTEHGTRISTITVQLDFTKASDPDGAATGAEAGVQLGATLKGTKKIALNGDDDARRVDFAFTSTGKENTPPKGSRVQGTILTGLDSKGRTFAVRIDAQQGRLADADLKKIIDSVTVH